ncbi:hypothetical protein KY284_020075 [Solanum tuberosum]|nr:hypothetical protein KY284_020075 [Solanum tuberosum]
MGWITQKEEENEEFQVQRNRKHLGRGRIQVWNPKTTQPEKGVKEMMTTGNQFEALHDPDLRDAEETGTKEKTPTNKWVGKPKGDEEQRNTIEHEKEVSKEKNQDQNERTSSYMEEDITTADKHNSAHKIRILQTYMSSLQNKIEVVREKKNMRTWS